MSNEAAERLREITDAGKALIEWAERAHPGQVDIWTEHAVLIEHEALRTERRMERRMVVDEIRAALAEVDPDKKGSAISAILDEIGGAR